MTNNINLQFCRTLLSEALKDITPVTTIAQRKEAWVYHTFGENWEFHGPNDFYWYGSADNAYHARAQGWMAWLEKSTSRSDT